ncbi:MAG: hypothetical protein QOG94_2839 [Solirubrobacteraceae bacterium]|nr:hypothetical protein [Solirubrobacteraceae bacterium]
MKPMTPPLTHASAISCAAAPLTRAIVPANPVPSITQTAVSPNTSRGSVNKEPTIGCNDSLAALTSRNVHERSRSRSKRSVPTRHLRPEPGAATYRSCQPLGRRQSVTAAPVPVTRVTSAIEVIPRRTFSRPSSRSSRMPWRTARSAMSGAGARASASLRISSDTDSTS